MCASMARVAHWHTPRGLATTLVSVLITLMIDQAATQGDMEVRAGASRAITKKYATHRQQSERPSSKSHSAEQPWLPTPTACRPTSVLQRCCTRCTYRYQMVARVYLRSPSTTRAPPVHIPCHFSPPPLGLPWSSPPTLPHVQCYTRAWVHCSYQQGKPIRHCNTSSAAWKPLPRTQNPTTWWVLTL